jgi:hypothetical protein
MRTGSEWQPHTCETQPAYPSHETLQRVRTRHQDKIPPDDAATLEAADTEAPAQQGIASRSRWNVCQESNGYLEALAPDNTVQRSSDRRRPHRVFETVMAGPAVKTQGPGPRQETTTQSDRTRNQPRQTTQNRA